jgi:hypothetical protein
MKDSLTYIAFLNPVALAGWSILIWGALRSTGKRWDENVQATNATVIFAFLGIFLAMAGLAVAVGISLLALLFWALKANSAGLGVFLLLIVLGPSLVLVPCAIISWFLGPRIGRMIWRSSSASGEQLMSLAEPAESARR